MSFYQSIFFLLIFPIIHSSTSDSILSSSSSSSSSSSPSSPISPYQPSFCSFYPSLKNKNIPKVTLPSYQTNTSFDRVFQYLLKNSRQFPSLVSNHSTCYQWKCVNKENKECIYCTPSIYVGGFSKCGTTALCSKLLSHPLIRQYPYKEVNFYAKFPENSFISSFEKRVIHPYNDDNKDENIDVRQYHMLDCTSGSYREISSVANLLKYSPLTKVIYIIRDPWQRMGSWLTMAHRSQRKQRFSNVYKNWLSILQHDIPTSISTRFHHKIIKKLINIFPLNGFLYGEILLYWKLAFPNRLLIIDHYDLENQPRQIMKIIENFLNISNYNYSLDILLDTSINTMISVQNSVNSKNFQFIQNDTIEARKKIRNISPKGIKIRTENMTNIHEPYVFDDYKMLELVKDTFGPSLCLYEKIFHQYLKIVTDRKIIEMKGREEEKEEEKEEER